MSSFFDHTKMSREQLRQARQALIADARQAAAEWTVGHAALRLYRHKWTFAKTMAANPHWYTLRVDWFAGDLDWHVMVQYIRDQGRKMRFGKTDYTVWDLNGYRYWSMGDHLDRTLVINRAANVGTYEIAAVPRTWGDGQTGGEVIGGPAESQTRKSENRNNRQA
jgi:hypothetical protein